MIARQSRKPEILEKAKTIPELEGTKILGTLIMLEKEWNENK